MTAAGPLRRSVLVALVAAVAITVVSSSYLAIRQAPSGDEVHTLIQTRDATLDTWRSAYRRSSVPPAYYLVAWGVGRVAASVGVSALTLLRTLSILGWATASACLGLVIARRGGGWASVFVAGCVPTASGLVGQSFASRPYGLVMGATAVAIVAWERSLDRPRLSLALMVGLALVAATSVHYAVVTVVPCFLGAEAVARRRDPSRTWAFPVLMVAAVTPVLVLQGSIRRSIKEEDALVHFVSPASIPAFYASVGRPVFLASAVVAVAAGLWSVACGGWRRGQARTDRDRPGHCARLLTDRALHVRHRPLAVLSLLITFAVPVQVVLIIALTSGDYLHRYAIVALLGLALVAAGLVLALEQSGSAWPPFAAAAVALAIPLALASAQRETPTRHQVHRVAVESKLEEAAGSLFVYDPYLYGLFLESLPPSVSRRMVLVGPSTVVGMDPAFNLSDPPASSRVSRRTFLLMDALGLQQQIDRGRVTHVHRVGTTRLTYGGTDRPLVGAMVTLVPA